MRNDINQTVCCHCHSCILTRRFLWASVLSLDTLSRYSYIAIDTPHRHWKNSRRDGPMTVAWGASQTHNNGNHFSVSTAPRYSYSHWLQLCAVFIVVQCVYHMLSLFAAICRIYMMCSGDSHTNAQCVISNHYINCRHGTLAKMETICKQVLMYIDTGGRYTRRAGAVVPL